jgi:hypothetical protein
MKYHYRDLELYKQLHKSRHYGDTGFDYVDDVLSFIHDTSSKTILDFGSGTGSLAKSLYHKNIAVDEFDPCYPGKDNIVRQEYDLIITTDVLEHIYEDEISNIFEEMLALKPKFMYHAISTRTATNLLPDGSNCHKTVKNSEWWVNKITEITNSRVVLNRFASDTAIIKVYRIQ